MITFYLGLGMANHERYRVRRPPQRGTAKFDAKLINCIVAALRGPLI